MSRLTIKELINHCNVTCERQMQRRSKYDNIVYQEHASVREYLKELQHYKDLEEQGRLIELPCKVGDTVYLVHRYREETRLICNNVPECEIVPMSFDLILFDSFGKTVFLTKEEAEAKLKELKGE